MKYKFLLLILIISVIGCKSSKKTIKTKTKSTEIIAKKVEVITVEKDTLKPIIETPKSKAEGVIEYAKQFEGVRYKWGGTTSSGMDCSGLVYESFKAHDIILPRISRDMAKLGAKILLKDVTKGDLLFFNTGNRRNSIDHVGLIISINNNDIEFIHATTKKGVTTSWLNEDYWSKAFIEARRIL